MKVGGGLRYVTGPMGAGKTFYGVRAITYRLLRRQYVVTNVRLLDDAPERIAFYTSKLSKRKRQVVVDNCRRYYVFERNLSEAQRYRPDGKGESRALFIWDEAHNDLNNRTYRDRDQALLEWATQLRKMGYEGVLLTQSHENTDAQLRRICNWHVRLQNQKESVRVLGMRSSPWPLFIAWWYMANVPQGSKQKPMRTERYFLNWMRKLYDTHDLFHGLTLSDEAEMSNVIRLPVGGLAPTTAEGGPPAGWVPSEVGEALPRALTFGERLAALQAITERPPLPAMASPESYDGYRGRRDLPES